MAKQISFIKFTGKIGDVVGYKFNNEYLIRKQPDFSGIDRANAPSYQHTRKLNAEFANTAKDSKLFRMAFIDVFDKIGCKNLHGKLNGKFLQMLKKDTVNEVGNRRAHHSDFSELHRMELAEKNAQFFNAFIGDIDFKMDEDTGIYKIRFGDVHFSKRLYTSKTTNSCRLMASVAKIDFMEEKYSVDFTYSEFLPLKKPSNSEIYKQNEHANFDLELKINPEVKGKLFAILGIEYSSVVNGFRQLTYGHSGMVLTNFSDGLLYSKPI